MHHLLTAQPIHADGTIGFDTAPPLEVHSSTLMFCFVEMARRLEDVIPTYPEAAWDLTLTVMPGNPPA